MSIIPPVISASPSKRQHAEAFFSRLEEYLDKELRRAPVVTEEILGANSKAQRSGKTGIEAYEGPFFKKHVVPTVYSFLTAELPADGAAKQALLAEGYLDLKDYASGTPASKMAYPYKKTVAATLKNARKDWWENGKVLSNSCPDLALRHPCGLSVVFEGKLFRSGGLEAAKSAIVAGIYECFFYRALPTLLGRDENASSYEYACFLAYDASPNGSLSSAWRTINKDVKRSCWEALNIRVMILPMRPA